MTGEGALPPGDHDGTFREDYEFTDAGELDECNGMTRNGTYRIEGGEVAGPVQNMRFTQSLVEALARVTGVGAHSEVGGALFEGEAVVPALRIDGFRFTSTSDC